MLNFVKPTNPLIYHPHRPFSSSKRKNLFFLKRYLEVTSGPTPRLKAALLRKAKATFPVRNIHLPHYLKNKKSKHLLKQMYLSLCSSYEKSIAQKALRDSLYSKKARTTFRQNLTRSIYAGTSPAKLSENTFSENPLNFSKLNTIPYLRSKYETYGYILSPSSLSVYENTVGSARPSHAAPIKLLSLLRVSWLAKWQRLVKFYTSLNSVPHSEMYLRARKVSQYEVKHYLQFKFKGSKLSINLLDLIYQLTHISVSPGLFVKFFQNKKSLKKNKSMKLLMVRFFRKLLLALRLKNVIVLSRGVPVHLDLLLSTLFRPLSHPFVDPLSGKVIDETQTTKGSIGVSSLLFLTPKPFGSQKTRKKGRVKRKIRRKLVRLNSVID